VLGLLVVTLFVGAHANFCSTSIGSCWQNRCPSNWSRVYGYSCSSWGYVCCKRGGVVQPPTQPPTSGTTIDTGTVVTDGSCGKTIYGTRNGVATSRIVGGREAKKGEFPWQVQVQYRGGPNCGAVLISDQWILSAAHCFKDRSTTNYKFIVGRHKKYSNDGTDQVFTASHILVHESYKGNDNDIVMIKINGRVKLNNYARTACLPSNGESFDGQRNCWVSGWGTLSFGGSGPRTLNAVSVPIVPLSTCKKAYWGVGAFNICGGFAQGGKDSCQGDSGGPYVCKKPGQNWKVVGIVSYGDGCAKPGKYGVYSNVAYFYSWIQRKMQQYG